MSLAMHTDFALRTLLYLGTKGARATVEEAASFYGISAHHLGKVVNQLGRLGYVKNLRGPKGGMELAKKPSEISVGAVVRAFEGREIHLLECIETPGVCVIQPGCFLRGVLAEAERRQMEYLDGVTLANILPATTTLGVSLGLAALKAV
ncbi:MAG: Rrf2 family transcriptional regulator [Isosphaeraceae bacterium]